MAVLGQSSNNHFISRVKFLLASKYRAFVAKGVSLQILWIELGFYKLLDLYLY
jgi:hypothetical protein